jgi:succinate dehydrogenase / fumarate reductase iron-sulfur subunit
MVREMDRLGFGNCSNETECQAECPKEISIIHIARLNRELIKAELGSPNM